MNGYKDAVVAAIASDVQVAVDHGNVDLRSMSIEELQQEALRLKQQLVRSKAEAEVAMLRAQLIRSQHRLDSAPDFAR